MTLEVIPVTGMPEVRSGDDLAALLGAALTRIGLALADGDVLVVSSKVASKAAGLTAPAAGRSSVIAAQSRRVVAERDTGAGMTQVVEAAAGPVMAAAGVDASNTGPEDELLVLPSDPDAVCREVRDRLCAAAGVTRLAIVLSDTAGRPWRAGQVDFALGCAGLVVLDDLAGTPDADGRTLSVTARALADEVASAADLVKGKAAGIPAALLRGLGDVVVEGPGAGARAILRVGAGDWFAYGWAEAVRAALGVEPGTPLAHRLGVASTAPEPVRERIARAVAVALHGLDTVGVDVGEDEVLVTGPDPVERGIAAARVCVALFGEGVHGRIVGVPSAPGAGVRVTLTHTR